MATPLPKQTTINGKSFEIRRMRIFDAAEIHAYLLANVAPMFAGQTVNPGNLAAANILVLKKVLATVLWLPGGDEPMPRELSNEAAIEDAFAFDTESMYTLVWEVLEYNRFPFFEKVKGFLAQVQQNMDKAKGSSGNGTTGTDGSKPQTPNVPKTSKRSDA